MHRIFIIAAAAALAGCGSASHDPTADHSAAGERGAAHAKAGGSQHGDAADHAAADHGARDDAARDHDAPARPAADKGAAAHWTYAAQDAWREASPEAAACAVGGRQSPINLYDQPHVDAPDLTLAYAGVEGAFFNNGHTLQIALPQGLAMNVGGETYGLVQAHFHAPGEHHVDGETFGLELHLVHKTAAGKLGVLGVLFREGKENPALAALWARIPGGVGEDKGARVYFDPAAFLPADRAYYAYDGSLTTPPCSEGVRWRVLRAPVEASAAQIAAFREVVGENARELQPINGRLVSLGE